MGTQPFERKLAAILYADVAGYSRLTGEDEEATHRTLSAYLDAITTSIEKYHGTVMHFAGDAVLAEFAAVSDALGCAIDAQHELKERNRALPENRQIRFRMGVNLGEVIVDRGEIYGDGVNVAARLESLAEPSGICLSESVHTTLGNRLPLDYEDLGEQSVKNIEKPVRAYSARLKPGAARPAPRAKRRRTLRHVIVASAVAVIIIATGVIVWLAPWAPTADLISPERAALPLSNKPSIAVLPFDNLSGDPEQDYFADGISEDLTTDLSKISGLFVIARNSTFRYKGKPLTPQQIAEELGVRYVLEGSVRRAVDQVRINAQLIDATTGGHVWAERYDGSLNDVFTLQDKVTQAVVAALAVKLGETEKTTVVGTETREPAAYDALLRGLQHYQRGTPDHYAKAIEYFTKAAKLDIQYGRAYAALGSVYFKSYREGWHDALGLSGYDAWKQAKHHLELAMKQPTVLAHQLAAEINVYRNRHDEAIAEAKRAIAIDPNGANGHTALAFALLFSGRPEEALDPISAARRVDPSNEFYYAFLQGLAEFGLDRFQMALVSFEKAIELNPDLWSHVGGEGCAPSAPLLATYAYLGREQAAEELKQKLFGSSECPIKTIMYWWPYKETHDAERLSNGLHKAGLD